MIELTTQQAEDGFNKKTFFKKHFREACSADTQAALAAQYANTNQAIRLVLEELESLGRCFFPADDHRRLWSVIECSEAMSAPFYVIDKKPGVLRSAAIFAEGYGKYADQLLHKPLYGKAFRKLFDIDLKVEDERPGSLLKQITCASAVERPRLCTSLLASHRAFEKSFVRLSVAIRAYMKTFAREATHTSGRTIPQPCRRVFYKPSDTWTLCKWPNYGESLGRLIDPKLTCERARANHIWKRNSSADHQTDEAQQDNIRRIAQQAADNELCPPKFLPAHVDEPEKVDDPGPTGGPQPPQTEAHRYPLGSAAIAASPLPSVLAAPMLATWWGAFSEGGRH
eukprot:TRINITY_DN5318_c0_g3_i1.p1 TRINITY_DN5318_c0_g3~~TRINITY_DN5318_c0_g3_i1.p1  ORF type:complete len:340 (-),score=74.18 TRINITY_DN5318_c0_g3_i1:163-1182(-)